MNSISKLFSSSKNKRTTSTSDLSRESSLRNSQKYFSCQNLKFDENEENWHQQALSRCGSSTSLVSQFSTVSKFSWTDKDGKIPPPDIRRSSAQPTSKRSDPKRASTKRRNTAKSWNVDDFKGMAEHGDLSERGDDSSSSTKSLGEKRPIPPERTKFNQLEKGTAVTRSQTMMTGRPSTMQKNKGKSMWHEEYPETYLEIKSSKMEVERQSIIHEIAQSHRDFYDDLQHVKAVYVRGLTLFGGLDSNLVNALFGNLEEVISVNDGLEDELNNMRDHRGMVKSIGSAFSKWVPKITCYADYAKGLVNKRPKLEECFQRREVAQFLEAAQSAQFSRRLSLWSFLDAPRSNLPRLKMQLERLCKKTPETNVDKGLLPDVISELDRQIRSLNDSIAEAEYTAKVAMLVYKNKDENEDYSPPLGARKLLFNGDIKYKGRDTSELLLFDTCIVVGKSKGKSRLDVVFAAPLDEVNLSQPQNFEPRLILTRTNYRKNFVITTKEHSDARKWTDTFKEAKEAHELELNRIESDKNALFLNGSINGSNEQIEPDEPDGTLLDVEETDIGSVSDPAVASSVERPLKRPPRLTKSEARPSSVGLWLNTLLKKDKSTASPKPSRRNTIDGADNKSAIENAKSKFNSSETSLDNNSVESIPQSLTHLSVAHMSESSSNYELDLDSNQSLPEGNASGSQIFRSPSSVSGTSFESSESDGFVRDQSPRSAPVHPGRRSAIYQKPKTDFCEDEPDSEPHNLSLQDTIASKTRPVLVVTGPSMEIHNLHLNYPHPELEQRLSILSEKSDEMDGIDSDTCHSPESFDSGHPVSPIRRDDDDPIHIGSDIEHNTDHIESLNEVLHTPRSITLSEMGSEIDVDQSLNLRGLYHYKYNDCIDLANAIVTNAIQSASDMIHDDRLNASDSGTDSFSEQMEEELDALASHLVGKAIGLVHTELTLTPIP